MTYPSLCLSLGRVTKSSNNFAISSGGIGEALQRSASSMMAANNSLDETIALITAANTVVQDPASVGQAFKTISMRIRGAKTELEEAGLETEGMVESTAKLRSEIKALTGVDIMDGASQFKSTYQIMKELADKWQDLSDIQQATVTELIAGKRQGNIVSSLMSNFNIAEEALETSLNSAGSAMKEHEKWQQSLEAQILKLKAAWQGLSQAFLSSDFLKSALSGIVELVEGIAKLIDTIGTIPTLLGAFVGFKGIKGILSALINGSNLKELGGILGILKTAFPNVTKGVKKLVTSLKEVSLASGGAGSAFGGFISLIMQHPYIAAAAAAVIALTAAFTYQKKKAEEVAKEVEELTAKYREQREEALKLKNDYDTSNESSMISRYKKLSKGVGEHNENLSLTIDEYAEYQDIVNKIADQFPKLITGYDEEGNAILSCKDNVEQLTAAYEDLIHKQNEAVLKGESGNKITEDWKNTIAQASGYNLGEGLGNGLAWLSTFIPGIDHSTFDMKLNTAEWLASLTPNTSKKAIKEGLGSFDNTRRAEIIQALQKQGYDVNNYTDISKFLEEMLDEEPEKIQEILNDYYAGFEEAVAEYKTKAQALLSEAFDVSSAISKLNYDNIGEELQNVARQTVDSLDFDALLDIERSGKSIEQWTTELLNQLNSIKKEDNAAIEAGFELQTKFNGGKISYGEYVNNLRNLEDTIDNLALKGEAKEQLKISLNIDENGIVDQYDALVKRLSDSKNYDFNIDESEAKRFLDGLTAEEYAVAVDVITRLDSNGVYETLDEVEKIIHREMMLQGLTFELNLEVESAGIDALNTALTESVAGSGLSSESIAALKGRYAELEAKGYDLSSMFETTSHGIHLNREEFNKLEKELSNQKLTEINGQLEEMQSAYDQLGEDIRNCTDPVEKAKLFSDRQLLAQRISEAAELASQYQGLTSAYNDWLAAEESGQERDMYEKVIEGFENIDNEISRGWYDDGTIEFLELLSGKDLTGASITELKQTYKDLGEEIKNTGYTVRDFFTVNEDGESTNTGVYNFLRAVESLETDKAYKNIKGIENLIQRDENKNIIGFDFQILGGDEAIAEALGISEELVQILLRAADDAGFVVSLDGTYKQYSVLANEAEAAANKLRELSRQNNEFGKKLKEAGGDFEFDFNTSNIESLEEDLKQAKNILDTFKDPKTGEINLNADGAVEAMQLVSTLQARLDDLKSEQYGIGLTVEDEEYEEIFASLQEYGRTVATLNQLKINPTANTEEIAAYEAKLEEIAQEFADLPDEKKIELGLVGANGEAFTEEYFNGLTKDQKIEMGLVGEDGQPLTNYIDAVQSQIESGSISIPTTIDIQTNMDKTLTDLKNIMLLGSGLLSDEQEEALKIQILADIDVKAGEVNDSDVKETVDRYLGQPGNRGNIENTESSSGKRVHGGTSGTFKTTADVEIKAGEVDASNVEETVKNEVKTGAEGQKSYRIGVPVDTKLETKNVDNSDVKKKTEEAVESEKGKTETLEKEVELELKIGDYINNLSEFEDVAKRISELDKDISTTVTANIEGNVLGAGEDISNLNTFAEGAKALQDVKSSDVSVEVELETNLNEANGLDELIKFADGAKALDGVKSSDVSVKVELECEFNGGDLDSLAKFVESAATLDDVKSSDVSVKVELDSNLNEYSGNLEDLGTFANNAKLLNGVKDADVSIKVVLESEFNEANFDNLAKFVDAAQKLQGVKDSEISISANLDGNLGENANIDKLETFAEGAKLLQDIESKEIKITSNLFGNLINNPNLYNLEDFADGAEKLQDVKGKEVEITTNLYGNLIDNPNLYSLDDFAEGAEKLQDSKSKEVEITANLYGNLIQNSNLYNLDDFAEGAEALQNSKSKEVEITANLYGNLAQNSNLYSLEDFADSTKELQDIESKKVEVTANLYGNLVSNPNIYNLEDFAEGAEELQNVNGKKVEITANLYGNLAQNPNLYSLDDFADEAKELQSIESKKVEITSNLYGNLAQNPNLYNLKTFANGAEELQGIESKNVRVDANLYGNLIGNGNLANLGIFADRARELQGIGNVNVSVKANVDSASINTAVELLSKVANSGLFKDYNATVKVGAKIDKVDDTAVQEYKAPKKDGKVSYSVDSVKVDSWKAPVKKGTVNYSASVEALTRAQKHKTGTITYKANIIGLGGAAGTANAVGTAFAHGNWGVKGNGVALGGELGRELVVRDGRFFTIGNEGAEFFHYKKNDIIFNAAQTESLFKYGGIKGANPRGKVLANGTAYAEGTAFSSRSISESTEIVVGVNKVTGEKYTKDKDSDSKNDFEETIDWVETAIERIERDIDNLDREANRAYKSWGDRNKALTKQLSAVREEINLQQKAYKKYMEAANAVGLSSSWINKIKNGAIDIDTITDEVLKEKIDDYQKYYEAALKCLDTIEELKDEEYEFFTQRFDNIVKKYEGVLDDIEHQKNLIEEYMSQYEGTVLSDYVAHDAKSYQQIASYYQQLIRQEQLSIVELEKEKAELLRELQNWAVGTEAYNELKSKIYDIELQIAQANTSIVDGINKISQSYKDAFDDIAQNFENMLSVIEHKKNMIEEAVSQSEAQGWLTSKEYYNALIGKEQENIAKLEEEKASLLSKLQEAMEYGHIEKYSNAW